MEKQFVKPLDDLLGVGLGLIDFVKIQFKLRVLKFTICCRIEELFRPKLIFEGDLIIDEVEPKTAAKPKAKRKKKEVVKVELPVSQEFPADFEWGWGKKQDGLTEAGFSKEEAFELYDKHNLPPLELSFLVILKRMTKKDILREYPI